MDRPRVGPIIKNPDVCGSPRGIAILALIAIFTFLVSPCEGQSVDLDRDARLTTTELLHAYGYPGENHYVTTSDGYILGMHRVPNPGRPAVLVMHGMLSSSADFVLMGPGIALAYFLYDQGYDVWMGNCRGNKYSTAHVSLNPNSQAFWMFSWDELGRLDLPAMIDYVIAQTGQPQIQYIGHSQGTTIFWVMCSERPEYASKILAMHAMAGAAYMSNTLSPFARYLATYLTTTDLALQYLGQYYFAPNDEATIQGGFDDCKDGAANQLMCANVIFLIAGYNMAELNYTMLPVLNAHSPAGAASRQMIHFGQNIRAGLFRRFDFGSTENLAVYGQMLPPSYNLQRVTVPTHLYWGFNDWLVVPTDTALLNTGLPNVRLLYQVPNAFWNHLDFVWGLSARTLVYERMLIAMRSFS